MKKLFLFFLFLGVHCFVYSQSVDFLNQFVGDTKQTKLILYEKVDNPNFHKGLFLVIDTIYKVYTAESSGQYYVLRDSTERYDRQYLGFLTNNRFEDMTVFRDKDSARYWVWMVNDKGELEKSIAPDFLFK